ncbi:AtpZ/AtpI family protein [Abyssisolibacter fermentans]|uniref:AtpZ/AtpI family protein n=1 Tax=Abyssisolibacter fermentans TaxID=1766203 RepID=UPI001FA7B848|nr:AtpZ/AtpI family protein [Abyssisolibacter fermentans]
MMMKKKSYAQILRNLALVSQIGISMLVPIVGGVFLGNYIDKLLGIDIIFLCVFTILGIIISFMNLYKIATKGTNSDKK